MLDQEIVFRKQVQEILRLYRIQKILMEEDIGFNQFVRCNQSTWLFYPSNPVRPGSSASLIEGAELSSTAMDGSTFPKSQVLPGRHNSVYNSIHLKPLALQLCLEQCASRFSEKKRVCLCHLNRSKILGNSLCFGNFSDQESLNLSLSIGDEDRGIKATTPTCFHQKDSSSTQNVIDLEVSTEGITNEEGNNSACTDRFNGATKSEPQISSLSENSSCPFGNDGKYYPAGFHDCHEALTVNKSSLKDSISHEAGILDLNKVHLDDSSYYSSDNLVTCHSRASSLSIFGASFDSIVMNSNNIYEISDPRCKGIKGCEAGLASDKVSPCKDLSCCMSDPKNKYTRTIWKLSGGQFTDPEGKCVTTNTVKHGNTNNDEISHDCQAKVQWKKNWKMSSTDILLYYASLAVLLLMFLAA